MWAPWHLPMTKAREFAYVGDSFSGREMARMGWATYAVPPEELAAFTSGSRDGWRTSTTTCDVLETIREPTIRSHGHPPRAYVRHRRRSDEQAPAAARIGIAGSAKTG